MSGSPTRRTGRVASILHLVLLGACAPPEAAAPALLPLPAQVAVQDRGLELTAETGIVLSESGIAEGEHLAAALRESTGFPWDIATGEPERGDIHLLLDPAASELGDEGYRITVDQRGALITAPSRAGLFYGAQTLLQLLPPRTPAAEPERDDDRVLPFAEIEDRPRFAWRGYMLDVARHFFPVEDVLRQIDAMAHHKLNRLHLHLTDDQGWRIRIDSWPLLTEIGGSTQVGGGPGGFYSKEDYARIVDYAAARHIVVIPEIDMPGHINAALASYGELNPDGEPTELYTGTSVGFSSLWLDGPVTHQFVTDVLTEVAAMTPGPWIHIGGDEAAATEPDDYVVFIRWVNELLNGLDKTLIGWEEVGRADLGPGSIAQGWLFQDALHRAADGGAAVIASPAAHAYLDMAYDSSSRIGAIWAGFSDLEDAYSWDPVVDGLTEEQVLGLEAPLWTESVETTEDIDYLTWPRLAGHSEIAWSPAEGRDWAGYRPRLARHGARLELMGMGFYRAPEVIWRRP